jgi:hypothetical protein
MQQFVVAVLEVPTRSGNAEERRSCSRGRWNAEFGQVEVSQVQTCVGYRQRERSLREDSGTVG